MFVSLASFLPGCGKLEGSSGGFPPTFAMIWNEKPFSSLSYHKNQDNRIRFERLKESPKPYSKMPKATSPAPALLSHLEKQGGKSFLKESLNIIKLRLRKQSTRHESLKT